MYHDQKPTGNGFLVIGVYKGERVYLPDLNDSWVDVGEFDSNQAELYFPTRIGRLKDETGLLYKRTTKNEQGEEVTICPVFYGEHVFLADHNTSIAVGQRKYRGEVLTNQIKLCFNRKAGKVYRNKRENHDERHC